MGRPKHPGCVAVIDGTECGDEVEANERCPNHYRFHKRNGHDGGQLRCLIKMDGDRCRIKTTATDRVCSFHAQQMDEQGRITRLHPPEKVQCIGTDHDGTRCERQTTHPEGLCADCRPTACVTERCGKPIHGRGLCRNCYQQKHRGQEPRPSEVRPQDMDPLERFAGYVTTTDDRPECWTWTQDTDKGGYGRFKTGNRGHMAYRWLWTQLVNPALRDDVQIDHVCHNPACVNPAHLQEATPEAHLKVTAERRKSLKALTEGLSPYGVKGVALMEWRQELGRPQPTIEAIEFATDNRLPFWFAGALVHPHASEH